MNRREYHASLPMKRMGAGAIIRDADGNVLIVKPTYKPGWEFPGGAVEDGESPAAACARELREELGFDVPVGRLLCVDYNSTTPDYLESLMFLFDGGTMSEADIQQIVLPADELSESRFVRPDEAARLLVDRAGQRLTATLAAPAVGGTYFENQTRPD